MNARAHQHLILPLAKHQQQIEHAFDIPSIKVLPSQRKILNIRLQDSEEIGLLKFVLTCKDVSNLEYEGWKIPDLPEDIEREIYGYFRNSLTICFQIDFRNRWPFRSPITSLLSCTDSTLKLGELFHRYNCDLRADWSPSLGFEKVVLMLLCRILEKIDYI